MDSSGVSSFLLETAQDPLFAIAPDGEILSWNWGATMLLGYEAAEVTGHSLYENVVGREAAGDFARATHEALQTGSAILEASVAGKDGRQVQVGALLRSFSVGTPPRQVLGVHLRDVTDAKRLEKSLFEQIWSLTEVRGFLSGVLDSSLDYAIVATELDGRIKVWSAGAQLLYGYAAPEAINRPASELLVAPDDSGADQWRRALEAAEKGRFEDEFQSVDRSGRKFPCRVSVAVWRHEDRSARGYVIIAKDVTDEKQTAAAIRRKTAFVSLLQNVAVAANEASSIEGAMQHALDEVCAATGWPVGHVFVRSGEWTAGLAPTKLWHLSDPERFDTFRRITEATRFAPGVDLPGRVLSSGTPQWIPDVTQDPNFSRGQVARDIGVRAAFGVPILVGKEIVAVLEFFSEQVLSPDEQVLEVMGHIGAQLGRVVERSRAEEERKANLERVIEVERLKDVNKFKEQFIRTVSHELNTPITPITLQLDMLGGQRLGPLNDTQARSVEMVKRNVGRLALLVQDMLDVARIQSGQLSITRQILKLSTPIGEAVELFSENARQAGVVIQAPPPNGYEVEVDPRRIVQVLVNLLSNALKFTPSGGRIQIDANREKNEIVVRVRDTGAGLTTEQISRLFRPFSQVHDPAAMTNPGTGLGLYICRSIIEQHGGRMGCQSDGPAKGSTFWFALPVRDRIVMRDWPPAPSRPEAPEDASEEASAPRAAGAPLDPPATVEIVLSRRRL